jgi:hypothetical protein
MDGALVSIWLKLQLVSAFEPDRLAERGVAFSMPTLVLKSTLKDRSLMPMLLADCDRLPAPDALVSFPGDWM